MPVVVGPMPDAFDDEVFGIDCRALLDSADIAAVHAGMARHAVLVLRDQPLMDDEQLAFTRRFGELERYETPATSAGATRSASAWASPIFPT